MSEKKRDLDPPPCYC